MKQQDAAFKRAFSYCRRDHGVDFLIIFRLYVGSADLMQDNDK